MKERQISNERGILSIHCPYPVSTARKRRTRMILDASSLLVAMSVGPSVRVFRMQASSECTARFRFHSFLEQRKFYEGKLFRRRVPLCRSKIKFSPLRLSFPRGVPELALVAAQRPLTLGSCLSPLFGPQASARNFDPRKYLPILGIENLFICHQILSYVFLFLFVFHIILPLKITGDVRVVVRFGSSATPNRES